MTDSQSVRTDTISTSADSIDHLCRLAGGGQVSASEIRIDTEGCDLVITGDGDGGVVVKNSHEDSVSYAVVCRECGKLTGMFDLDYVNYSKRETAEERQKNHASDTGHDVDILEIEPSENV